MARVAWFTSGSAAARLMKVPATHGVPPQNSWVVFDIPMDRRTYFPAASGLPAVSRGTTRSDVSRPAASCSGGIAFDAPGYRPPANPLYGASMSVSGTRRVRELGRVADDGI